jgi:hypothetical protein
MATILVDDREDQFPLPNALPEGYVMHISQKGENVYIWVRNNMGIKMNNSFVIGQFRGFPFITIHAKNDQDFLYSVINIGDIPSGIIQFTFFDALGVMQCERLVYTENNKNELNVSISTDKELYRKREEVQFDLHCEDMAGNFPLTNVSLSITNTAFVKKDDDKSHIRSYFNLESDLKGYIENPGYYFNTNNKDRFELLDILMLTHGWRRFIWQEVLEDKIPEIRFSTELGFNFEGRVFDNYNLSRPGIGKVRLYIIEGQFFYNEVDTDENGYFQFLGIDVYDSTEVVMQAWRESDADQNRKRKRIPESRKKLAIKMDRNPLADVRPDLWPDLKETEVEGQQVYFDLHDMIQRIDSSYDEMTILLEEVVVKDKMIVEADPFARPGKLHNNYIRRIVMDSLTISEQSLLLFDLVRKYYPNVSVRGMPPDISITIRGNRSLTGSGNALLLLDGLSVTSDFLYYFPVTEIAFIDVLSSVGASIYGERSANGAIAIYTRNEPSPYGVEEGRDWVLNFIHPGYHREREFYTPDYGQPEETHIKPDFRKILYWNPSLTTDNMGNVSFSFYTSDEVAEYRLELEGMTYDGIPVMKEYYFSVK